MIDKLRSFKEAKSEFLTLVGYELRTPLTSLIGFSNVLLRESATRTRTQEVKYLERIRANGVHLLSLIDELLDLATSEALKKEDLEVAVGLPRGGDGRAGRRRRLPEHRETGVRRERPARDDNDRTRETRPGRG